jgi:hypothetical protein
MFGLRSLAAGVVASLCILGPPQESAGAFEAVLDHLAEHEGHPLLLNNTTLTTECAAPRSRCGAEAWGFTLPEEWLKDLIRRGLIQAHCTSRTCERISGATAAPPLTVTLSETRAFSPEKMEVIVYVLIPESEGHSTTRYTRYRLKAKIDGWSVVYTEVIATGHVSG